jgi:hypothetical protein
MDSLLIIRPKVRWARWQAAAGIALAAAFVAGAWLADGSGELLVTSGVAGSASVAAIAFQRRLRLRGPQAIVATSEYLGLLASNGERRVVRWDAVQRAAHSTGLAGMRWKLRSSTGAVILRDVGVDPEQWKRLWWRVGFEVSRRGGPVVVDRISDALFD